MNPATMRMAAVRMRNEPDRDESGFWSALAEWIEEEARRPNPHPGFADVADEYMATRDGQRYPLTVEKPKREPMDGIPVCKDCPMLDL